MSIETQQIDMLFLELSQFTKAKTKREIELEYALEDARLFANVVECWGRSDCEIYKHELKHSADLAIERINKVIPVND